MNTFGRIFRVSLFGESHGEKIGALIDGCPAGISLSEEDFEFDMARRRPGALGTTPREESDRVHIATGTYRGTTTGAPILLEIQNKDAHSDDYRTIAAIPRPGHGDLPAFHKYGGFNDPRGGGHLSGRLTAPLVASGVIAKKVLSAFSDNAIACTARLIHIGGEMCSDKFDARIEQAIRESNPIGGVIEGIIDGLPSGLGAPFFDTFDGLLAQALFAIPGLKGVEFGLGFDFSRQTGRDTCDEILDQNGELRSNFSGGIDGGLTNGNPIIFRVAIKPAVSFGTLHSIDLATGQPATLPPTGRHDICFVRRVPPIVEALSAIVTLDQLRLSGRTGDIFQKRVDE